METIPKTIHYCWFGGKKKPRTALKCIKSWRKYLPGYKIKEWNESNFDLSSCRYAKEAYAAKKWAFVSDFVRLKVLYEEGGVYFDTDVEVIKPLDDLLSRGGFMGKQDNHSVNPGLGLAVFPHDRILGDLLEQYYSLGFKTDNGSLNLKTIVDYTTEELEKYGLSYGDDIQQIGSISIYPKDYFSPKDPVFKTLEITENTRTIHHFDGTWLPKRLKCKKAIQRFLGNRITTFLSRVKRLFKRK